MSSEADEVADQFVEALANVFQATRENGVASPELRSQLAKARAKAEQSLTTEQYGAAVFKAAHIAGWDWT